MRNITQKSSPSRPDGFTIIELMIVVAIIGVLSAIAIPAFNDLIKNNRRTVVVNELISGLALARTEAAKRGQPVTLCGNTSGGGISCTGATNWSYGWMVFLDGPPPADGAIAAVGDIIRQYKNDYADITVTSATGGTGHITLLPFNQRGTDGNLTICDSRGASKARRICIANNGRSRVSLTGCSDTSALTCP